MKDEYYLFRGCLIPTRLPFLERSSLLVLDRLGIAHTPLPGATCCVEPIGLRSLALDTWLVVAARMLSIAEEEGRDVLTLCNGCYVSLKEARHLLQSREEREKVNAVLAEIGREYRGKADIEHLAGLVRRKGSEIQSLTVAPLDKLRIAPHSGCHMLRPSSVTAIDASFSPHVLTDAARWVGADAVVEEEWPKCCGGGVTGVDDRLSSDILDDSIREFRAAGANCILTPCPFCFVQFDIRQKQGIPVLFLAEMLALAFGASPEEIGLRYHRTKVEI